MRRLLLLVWLFTLFGPRGTYAQTETPDDTPAEMPLIEATGDPLIVLLIGADTAIRSNVGRTDVLLLTAVDMAANSVSMLSLPRDLYVSIPGSGMGRINTAYAYGEQREPGTGPQTLIETIRYNLGLEVDYWARVDFSDFRQLIDDLGGVELVVDCAIQDWRLREPDLDPGIEDNWAQFTLPVGVHTLDGDLALWYARSRRTSSDFDRGRRHQALVQAIWRRVRALGLDTQLQDVWPQLLDLVDTDLPLDRALSLVPVGAVLTPNQIAHFTLQNGVDVSSWRSPEGMSVLVPNRAALTETLTAFLSPPTANQLRSAPVTVEIVNATGIGWMPEVAAWRLAWDGYEIVFDEPAQFAQDYSHLIDLSGQTKANPAPQLLHALNLGSRALTVEPTADREADFRLILGQDYYPCSYAVIPPTPNDDDDG